MNASYLGTKDMQIYRKPFSAQSSSVAQLASSGSNELRLALFLQLVLSLFVLPFVLGCSESTSPTEVFVGRLEGTVEDASGPVAGIEVTAERFEVEREYVAAKTDSLGRFRLQLLPGNWIVHVERSYYDRGRLRPLKAQAEILSVTERDALPPIQARFGGIKIQLSAGEFEGERIYLTLETPIFGERVGRGWAIVEDGVASFSFPRVPVTEARAFVDLDGAYSEIDFLLEGNPVEIANISGGVMQSYSARLRPETEFTIDINTFLLAEPGPRIELEIVRSDRRRSIRRLTVSENGTVRFKLRDTVPFHVRDLARRRTQNHIAVDRYLTSYAWETEPPITFSPGAETALPAFEACALEIRFQTEIQSEGTSIVQIRSADGKELLASSHVATNSDGREFRPRTFTGLIPGTISLAFVTNQDHLIGHWYPPSGPSFEPQTFVLGEAGTKTVVDWPLYAAPRIRGTVVDESGIPLNDVFLSATGLDNNYVNRNLGRSDEDGKFDVGPFPPGTYTLGGFRYPGISRWYPGVESEDEAVTLQLDWGSSQDSLVFVFR